MTTREDQKPHQPASSTCRENVKVALRFARGAAFGAVAVALLGGGLLAAVHTDTPTSGEPAAPGSVTWLIARHHCWTRTQPADVWVPGHIVVTLPGHDHPTYGGPRLTGKGLDHELPAGAIVHAYCR